MDNRFEKRESNFELLRIIAMILIVAHHSAMYNKTMSVRFGGNIFIVCFHSIQG